MEAWEALVERYKGTREVCNCRQAWYNRSGKNRLSVPASPRIYKGYQGVSDPDHHSKICEGGCVSNIALCREEIAQRVLVDLPAPFDLGALAALRKAGD